MYICAKVTLLKCLYQASEWHCIYVLRVSTILDWIVKLSRQCGIYSLYHSICLFLSSSYSDFYCSLIFLLRCFAALHMLSIRYPLLIYYASVYRGSVWMNGLFPYSRLVIGTSKTVGSAKKLVRITSGFGGGEFTKTLRKVCTCQKLKFSFLLLEYCKIRECYVVANAFTIRNMHSLFLYMKCNSRKINRPTKNMTKIVTLLHFISCS